CPPEILYSVASPDGFPSLNRVTTSGSPARLVTSRYLGSTTAIGRDTLYFDQLEQRRNVGLHSDLYALSRADGRVTQLTFDGRRRRATRTRLGSRRPNPTGARPGWSMTARERRPGRWSHRRRGRFERTIARCAPWRGRWAAPSGGSRPRWSPSRSMSPTACRTS